jgi:cobalt-zinc-cadmium efflux system outer membrane protein
MEVARWTGGTVQAELEVDPLKSGHVALGPGGSIGLPLFDQGQAAVARARALLRQSQRRLDALAIEVRSEVRVAGARVALARQVVDRYRKTLIPLRERIVALSQQQYDAMLLGVYQLIVAKQNEVSAYREYIEAVRDYWIARSDLERAVGGRIGAPPAPSPAQPQPAPAPAVDHSHMHM